MQTELSIPYVLSRHPGTISPDTFLQPYELTKGANCQLFVAGLTRARGRYMPTHYRSSEIFEDSDEVFHDVNLRNDLPETGDIIGFWPVGDTTKPKRIHVGIVQITQEGVCVLHSSREIGRVTREPLLALLQRYEGIACIKRPRYIIPDAINPTMLVRLGFYNSSS